MDNLENDKRERKQKFGDSNRIRMHTKIKI